MVTLLLRSLLEGFTPLYICKHGFMQDQIIASHTCFGEHMDVNCKPATNF